MTMTLQPILISRTSKLLDTKKIAQQKGSDRFDWHSDLNDETFFVLPYLHFIPYLVLLWIFFSVVDF